MNSTNINGQRGENARTNQQYATKADVARMFQVTVRTIDSWIARGLVPFRKIGRTVRFSLDEIEQFHRENYRVSSERA